MGAKQKQSKKPEAVKVEEVKTFDQRTNAVQPFINSEGKQVNGSEDIEVGPTEPQIVSPKENKQPKKKGKNNDYIHGQNKRQQGTILGLPR